MLTSSHDNDAGKVHQVPDSSAEQGSQRGIILGGGHAVLSRAVGPQARGVLKGLGQNRARVVDVTGGRVAKDHTRLTRGGSVRLAHVAVLGSIHLRPDLVGHIPAGRQPVGYFAQLGVELKDLGAVGDGGILEGEAGAVADVPRGPAVRQGPRIDLILQCDLNGEAGNGDRAEGGGAGVDAGDAA